LNDGRGNDLLRDSHRREDLAPALGREPSLEDLAQATGLPLGNVRPSAWLR
jgi:hypothetical protein